MVNKPNVQDLPVDLRKRLFNTGQMAQADMQAVEESLIRHEVQKLSVRTLAGCSGHPISYTNVMAQTLFRLGSQHDD